MTASSARLIPISVINFKPPFASLETAQSTANLPADNRPLHTRTVRGYRLRSARSLKGHSMVPPVVPSKYLHRFDDFDRILLSRLMYGCLGEGFRFRGHWPYARR
jgi:hypothetical protein